MNASADPKEGAMASDTVSARWVGPPVVFPTRPEIGEVACGDVVDNLPRGEAEASDNWEVIDKTKPKKDAD